MVVLMQRLDGPFVSLAFYDRPHEYYTVMSQCNPHLRLFTVF